jgi:hypothetical protein
MSFLNEYIENHVMEQVFTKYSSETWLSIIPSIQMDFFKYVWMNRENEYTTHKIVLGVEITDYDDWLNDEDRDYTKVFKKKNKEIFCIGEEEAKRCLDITERIFGDSVSYRMEEIKQMKVSLPMNVEMMSVFKYPTYLGLQHRNSFLSAWDGEEKLVNGQFSCLYHGAIAYLITGFHSDIPSAQRFLYNRR